MHQQMASEGAQQHFSSWPRCKAQTEILCFPNFLGIKVNSSIAGGFGSLVLKTTFYLTSEFGYMYHLYLYKITF